MMTLARRTAWFTARALRRVARGLDRAADTQTLTIQRGMAAHDMVGDPDEHFYGEIYWQWLRQELSRIAPNGRALEIGCGQGRFTVPLARALHAGRVVAVDITPAAIDAMKAKAAAENLTNIDCHTGDAETFLAEFESESFDLVLMIEVSFFMPRFREVIGAASRLLRRGGLLFASFRSQHYNLLRSVHEKDWRSARLVVEAREGEWGGTSMWFTWQTPEDIRQLLTGAGLVLGGPLRGIGICSGIEGDPLAGVARPSTLSDDDRRQLMEVEISVAEKYAACARYIVAVAVKQ